MNDLRTSPTFDSSGDELEGMLRSFFRAEVPDPWPMMKAPEPVVKLPMRKRSPWLRVGPRLAVAASVAFLLLGYLALGSIFPKHEQVGPNPGERNIAKDNRPKLLPIITPKGFKNLMEEKVNPDRSVNFKFYDR
jgi:hypothetical protein